jgi:hypothetical protein
MLTQHTHPVFLVSGSQQSSKLMICSHPDAACTNNEVRDT